MVEALPCYGHADTLTPESGLDQLQGVHSTSPLSPFLHLWAVPEKHTLPGSLAIAVCFKVAH
jgi:hypothetical protein